MKKIVLSILFFGLLTVSAFGQTEPEDVALANDEFQDYFYESLTQKAIENYDKSILALDKCLELQPNSAVVYFELGKNYLAQKNYPKAYESFEKATQIDPTNKWFWVGMYDVCYETKNFNQAIIIVSKLIEFNKEYKEDLTSLYMNTGQFDKALNLINELNESVGKTETRENYKLQILQSSKHQSSEKENLIEQIKKYPKVEENYISLIYLYSESNQEEKALEVAKQLQKEIPNSVWAQVSLFKYHLNNNNGDEAVKSMNLVFASSTIDDKIKHRMLNEFLIYSLDKPQYDDDLQKAIAYFENDKSIKVSKEIGKFYQNKKMWHKAIQYYSDYLSTNTDDFETYNLVFQCYIESKKFDVLAKKSEEMVELYPLQPQFYYYAGLANNQIGKYKKAIDLLEMGSEYIINNKALEINFNIQLGEAYHGLGDEQKKEVYFLKAEKLLNQKK
ncbi:MAG TPA: tetratricopeptide repeat protein [Flavobacterium sp.]|nr:tetratricopeptide repeat protein [Flavobacterium sp.]